MADRSSNDVTPQSSNNITELSPAVTETEGDVGTETDIGVSLATSILHSDDKNPAEEDAAAKTTPAAGKDNDNRDEFSPSDEAVLAYLQKRGLIMAEKELKKFLTLEEQQLPSDGNKKNNNEELRGSSEQSSDGKFASICEDVVKEPKIADLFEKDEADREEDQNAKAKEQRMFLNRSSGGGLGYDLDSASTLPTWGLLNLAGVPLKDVDEEMHASGKREASLYIQSFTALQTWVLALPDDPAVPMGKYSLAQQLDSTTSGTATLDCNSRSSERNDNIMVSLGKGVSEILQSTSFTSSSSNLLHVIPPLPPSAKPELMAVCFPLLVHSYCELLEYGMEADAEALLSAWKWLYLPMYSNELRDLDRCNSTTKIVALNHQIITHKEHHGQRRNTQAQLDKLRSRYEIKDQPEHQILLTWERKVQEAVKTESQYFRELQSYPFLHRVRTSRMQISLSAYTYSLLSAFMARERLIPMSVLLMTKCHLSIEPRDPLPYTPACVLVDAISNMNETNDEEGEAKSSSTDVDTTKQHLPLPAVSMGVNTEHVHWAAPIAHSEHMMMRVEDREAAFPQYSTEASITDAASVGNSDFNRSLLLNGFRRLEALQIKQEHNDESRNFRGDKQVMTARQNVCDPLTPSAVLATCCASSSSAFNAPLESAAIEITCAKLCPGDGRKVAVGCEDSAIRIWCLDGSGTLSTRKSGAGKETVDRSAPSNSGEVTEAHVVLVGHKDGWPVFGVDFCKDGRSLISCGGDGTVRLWDTAAVGPYGRLAKVIKKAAPKRPLSKGLNSAKPSNVPSRGSASEIKWRPGVEIGGAALCVYRGHSYNTPIWDCRFAPSGYYFATCGGDTTGKIWTTDRPAPVRSLVGHLSSVNCIAWHPNVNYVVTGSDDNTCRMWDVQTGRCVRVLTGFHGWVASLEVCPSGKYVAAVDGRGVIGIYDLACGRRVNEYKSGSGSQVLSYSTCGSALACGGDDCAVRIWDVKGSAANTCVPEFAQSLGPDLNNPLMRKMPRAGLDDPVKVFKTRRTILLDLQYTNRNLLMCVGKSF